MIKKTDVKYQLRSIIRPFRRLTALLPALAAAAALSSCDSIIYDDEGDCDPHYKVRFVYERNLRYVDAFHAEVEEVTLYVVDSATGAIVASKHESGEALSSGSYLMDLDGIEPGTYTLVAWCGPGHRTSFAVGQGSSLTDLSCRLTERSADHPEGFSPAGSAVSKDLGRLYHGRLADAVFPDDQGTHIFTVDLTKNTNDVHIVLQQLSGDPVDESRFTFTICDENGLMNYDNSLAPDEPLTYYPWRQRSGYAGVEVPDYTAPDDISRDPADAAAASSRAITAVSAAVADLTVGRLMADRRTMVRIYNDSHELVASIPLTDYALLTKGRHYQLSDQDYLDYRDDYSMVLFLDENGRWISSEIYINSWHMVRQEADDV